MTTVPGTAITVSRTGGPDVLTAAHREFGLPGAGAVRVAVDAAGVAYGDLLLRNGLTPGTRLPATPGYDAVGTVDATGSGVHELSVGDRVLVHTGGTGGYATHVEARAQLAVPVPDGIDEVAAVALVLNYVTAWQMLTRVAAVGTGGTVVVHSAAGGVGSALAELAAVRGLHVIGTASRTRIGTLEARGITAVVREPGWAGAVRKIAPDGVDAVFDGIGGHVGRESFGLLGAGGHLVTYGASGALKDGRRSLVGLARAGMGGVRPSALTLLRRGVAVSGYLSATFVPAHPTWFREDLTALLALLADGVIAPAIAARLPLTQAAEAHRLLARGVPGKIVLTVGAP